MAGRHVVLTSACCVCRREEEEEEEEKRWQERDGHALALTCSCRPLLSVHRAFQQGVTCRQGAWRR
jgi:hypothetical protein